MLQCAKISLAQTGQGRAVHLRVAADVIVHPWAKAAAIRRLPHFGRFITPLVKDSRRLPVLRFLGQIVTPFQQQDARALVAQPKGQRPTTHSTADNNDVECGCHGCLRWEWGNR